MLKYTEKRGTCIYVCLRAFVISQQCSVTVPFGSYLPYPSIHMHPTEKYSGETGTASANFSKGSIARIKDRSMNLYNFVDFLKIEGVHQILFTINLIFKHYFRQFWGGLMKVLYYILKLIVVFFILVKQHC